MTDLRKTTLQRTGADVYVEVIDATRDPFAARIKGTHYEGQGRYIVQRGDLVAMRWGTVCATLEEAADVLAMVVTEQMELRKSICTGLCTSSEDAAVLSRRVEGLTHS
jgi:hypothetical protein